jgi:hypothetical protein
MSNAELAELCARETHRYFHEKQHDPGYCFELFRRAFKLRDQVAWEAVYVQYKPIIAGKIKRHTGFQSTNEDVEFFLNGAFTKMFKAVPPDRFDAFDSLAALVQYLKTCAFSMILDYNRTAQSRDLLELDESLERHVPYEPSPEKLIAEQLTSQQLWAEVAKRTPNPKERLVLEGLFALELKPRELYEGHKSDFESVDEIYRIKQNVLARLSRDEEFCNLFAN